MGPDRHVRALRAIAAGRGRARCWPIPTSTRRRRPATTARASTSDLDYGLQLQLGRRIAGTPDSMTGTSRWQLDCPGNSPGSIECLPGTSRNCSPQVVGPGAVIRRMSTASATWLAPTSSRWRSTDRRGCRRFGDVGRRRQRRPRRHRRRLHGQRRVRGESAARRRAGRSIPTSGTTRACRSRRAPMPSDRQRHPRRRPVHRSSERHRDRRATHALSRVPATTDLRRSRFGVRRQHTPGALSRVAGHHPRRVG